RFPPAYCYPLVSKAIRLLSQVASPKALLADRHNASPDFRVPVPLPVLRDSRLAMNCWWPGYQWFEARSRCRRLFPNLEPIEQPTILHTIDKQARKENHAVLLLKYVPLSEIVPRHCYNLLSPRPGRAARPSGVHLAH